MYVNLLGGVQAEPLGEPLCTAIEQGRLSDQAVDTKARVKLLVDEFQWTPTDAKAVWCFGPESDNAANALVDCTTVRQPANCFMCVSLFLFCLGRTPRQSVREREKRQLADGIWLCFDEKRDLRSVCDDFGGVYRRCRTCMR